MYINICAPDPTKQGTVGLHGRSKGLHLSLLPVGNEGRLRARGEVKKKQPTTKKHRKCPFLGELCEPLGGVGWGRGGGGGVEEEEQRGGGCMRLKTNSLQVIWSGTVMVTIFFSHAPILSPLAPTQEQERSAINPFTALARQISGLKDARMMKQTVYLPVL